MSQTALLGNLIEIKHGYAFRGQYFSDTPTNDVLVTPGNFEIGGGFKSTKFKYYDGPVDSDYILNADDLIVTMTDLSKEGDTLGYSARVPASATKRFLHNQRIGLINLKSDSISEDYLYWIMRSPEYQKYIVTTASGSTVKHTSPNRIYGYKINIPDKNQQKLIVDSLNAVDNKVVLNRRMNETLEQMGQALFRHYFIDNPEAYDWENKSLDEIAVFLNGLAMQKYPASDGSTLPVIKIREMSAGITSNTDVASAAIPEQYIVHDGDILFSWSGTLIVKPWCDGDGALNQHLFKVTSREYPKWFYYYWTKHHLQSFIETAAGKATTMGHIQRRHLTEAKVKVPPANRLAKANQMMEPILDQQITNELENRKLANLRDSLLPRLISGKIKV